MLAPIVVIGLGGVGSEITARLEKKVKEKNLFGKILFAVLDTDINTLDRIRQADFEGSMIQISKNMTVKEYLNKNEENSEWFQSTESLNIKSMTEGAGQVRAISRLAFDIAVRNGYLSNLENEISQLFQIAEYESYQTPRVLIISSLAGGTGSGIVLPLGLYIRRYFEEVLHRSSVIIKGMFLMPDVFKSILGNTFEQTSINANAYAAIKELDAFIKKGEGYLAEHYNRKLHLKLPNTVTQTAEEYRGLPYNYCYLFGGKNKKGNSLRSFQDYLDYVAECIYAQAFSPMQELNNSIEDNVFRIASSGVDKSSKDGFKRFCCAGTAVMNYPYERIVELLALKKAEKLLSEQWSLIDKEYYFELQKNEQMRKKGKYARHMSKKEFYIGYVNGCRQESRFIDKIYTDTMIENESGELRPVWVKYWECLEAEVDEWLVNDNSLKKKYDNMEGTLKSIRLYSYQKTEESFVKLIDFYEQLLREVKEELEKKRNLVGERFFGNRLEDETADVSYYLYWLKKENQFIHPNAVRFFLYNAVEMFEQKHEELKGLLIEEDEILDESQSDTFRKVTMFKKPWLNNLFKRQEMDKVIGIVAGNLEALKAYQKHKLLEEIAAKGSEYLQKLAREYEEFYGVFDYNVQQYGERVRDLKYSIQDMNGTITRYVCCDDKCLEYMETATIDVRNEVEIDSELSEVIFRILRDNAKSRNQKNDYQEVFQERLVSHWKEELKEKYGYILDMDVLEALEREGTWLSRKDAHAISRINHMWAIAEPLAGLSEGCMDLQKNFCAYSIELERKNDYTRDSLIQILKNSGGTADAEGAIDKNTILFYQVIYALNPANLKEMAIGLDAQKKEFKKGVISKGYYEMLENRQNSHMTPHIDWSWDRLDILPDFNTDYQRYMEKSLYQVFLYESLQSLGIVKMEDKKEKYCMDIAGKRIDAATLHEIFVKYFISNYSWVEERRKQIFTEVKGCIDSGKKYTDYEFLSGRQEWAKQFGGVMGVIYRVNVDGGINEYNQTILRDMIAAFEDLLKEILTAFVGEDKASPIEKEMIEAEWNKYKLEYNEDVNPLILQDMKYALGYKD